jgi:hypothetical protein
VNGSDYLFIFENRTFLLFLAQINIHFGIKCKNIYFNAQNT